MQNRTFLILPLYKISVYRSALKAYTYKLSSPIIPIYDEHIYL